MIPDSERYDRQIRVFGLNTQQKLSQSNILIIGTNLLTQEILKNLVLTGIRSISILSTDQTSPILGILGNESNREEIITRCNQINSNVSVHFITNPSIDNLHFDQFDAVFVTDLSYSTFNFPCSNVFFVFSNGSIGIFIHPPSTETVSLQEFLLSIDPIFNDHQESKKRSNKPRLSYSFFAYNSQICQTPIESVLQLHNVASDILDWKCTEDSCNLLSQLPQQSAVCSVIGGFACQFVIKAIADCQNISFAGNCFAFDSSSSESTCALYQLTPRK